MTDAPTPLVLGEEHRLHPLTMITRLGDVLRKAWGAAAGAVYFIYQGQWLIAGVIVGAVILGTLLRPLIQWLSFTYAMGGDGIEMKSGILSRNHRSIPFDRVQDVNLEQNPLHRLFKLAKVKLETGGSAGGREEDGIIDSITLADARRLSDAIRAHRSGTVPVAHRDETESPEEDRGELVFSLTHRRLLLLGVFNFSLAVIGVLFGAAQTFGDFLNINPFSRSFWLQMADSGTPYVDMILTHQVVAGILGFVTLVVVGLATGILQTVLRDFRFRLRRTESGFRRQRGLLTLTDVVLPLRRVQAAIVATGPIRRHFGWRALKLQSLARDSGHGGDHVVAPLARQNEIAQVLSAMDWRPVSPDLKGWHRPSFAYVGIFLLIVIPAMVVGLAISAVGAEWRPAIAAGIVAILMTVARIVGWRHHRHRRDGDRVLIHSGAWRQRLLVLPLDRIQSIDVHRGPLDRLFGVSTVQFGVAGGRGFHRHAIHAVRNEEALDLRRDLLGHLT